MPERGDMSHLPGQAGQCGIFAGFMAWDIGI